MKYDVIITEEDRDNLEKLHYQVEARANLLNRLANNFDDMPNSSTLYNKYMEEYIDFYKQYERIKYDMELKYKPIEIASTAKSWYVNFETCTMTFEV